LDADQEKREGGVGMIEWFIIGGMAVAMYLLIYKYEKKMDRLHEMVEDNKSRIDTNHEKITKNHSRLDEHHSHIERMWVTIPKTKDSDQ
jgi:hypothetical protein